MILEQEIICRLARKHIEKAIDYVKYVKKGNLSIQVSSINIQSIYENPDSNGEIYIKFSVEIMLNKSVVVVIYTACYATEDGYFNLYDKFKFELECLIASLEEISEKIKRNK